MKTCCEKRHPLYRYWQQIPCCRAFNQMNVGVLFTINGCVQFANQQMCFYLKRKASTLYARGWYHLFRNNGQLRQDFEKAEHILNTYDCCYYMSQKSLFPKAQNHRLFKVMAFWIHPQNKSAGICWVFQDTTNLIEKEELTHYEETSLKLFELLRQSYPSGLNKKNIFRHLLNEIVHRYRLKTALYFEQHRQELKTILAIGNNADFPYAFDHVPIDTDIQESVAYQALKNKKPQGCLDISSHPFYQKYLKQPNDLSIQVATFSFPVIINRQVEGIISLYSYDTFFFSRPVVRQLSRLINEICLYIRQDRIKQKHMQAEKKLQKQLAHQIDILEKNKQIMLQQMAESNKTVADLIVARNQAEAANRSKMNFLANVSHELRTPLNAVLGFTQMMQAETFGPIEQPEYREYIGFIYKSATHLLSLINDILDLSRLEADKFVLTETIISLRALLQESLQLIAHYPHANERIFKLDMNEDIFIKADERSLKQIVLNALSNAVKFTRQNGHINIIVQRQKDGLTLIFEDDGIGIPAHKIDSLFQPFTQIENILTRTHQGSGLGLVLVKKMVILHQGSVRLESEEGKKTRLIIQFPNSRVIDKQDNQDV